MNLEKSALHHIRFVLKSGIFGRVFITKGSVYMEVINGTEIEQGLSTAGRVYLCGNLSQPNSVRHILTSGYEIGISDYSEYTFEKPHYHAFNTEYNYVLEGSIKILLLREKKEYVFCKGDLFVIQTNEPYVAKCLPGTRTIFSKDPGGNDKVLVPADDTVDRWGSAWDTPYVERG
jgi:hypothetical protein